MAEWGIALVGLVGALFGAVVAFIAVVWQHGAQKKHELRQRGAELIYLGEQIRDEFLRYRREGFNHESMAANQRLEDKEQQMLLILRLLELTAPLGTYTITNTYALSSGEFVLMSQEFHQFARQAPERRVRDSALEWQEAREALIVHLQGWQRGPIRALKRRMIRRRQGRERRRQAHVLLQNIKKTEIGGS